MATLRPSRGVIARTQWWYADELDDTASAGVNPIPPLTTATVAQRVGAQGEQTPRYQQVDLRVRWFDPGIGTERVPTTASAPNARVDADFSQDTQQLVDRTQRWYPRTDDDTDGPLPAPSPPVDPSPFAGALQGADPTEGISNLQQTWVQPADLLGIREGVPDAPVEAQVADQPDISGQQDRPLTPTWFQPDTEAFGDIPRAAPFDPVPLIAPTDQQPDSTEQRANGQRWFQAGDAAEGPLVGFGPPYSDDAYGTAVVGGGAQRYYRLDEPTGMASAATAAGWGTGYDDAVGGPPSVGFWVGAYTRNRPSLLVSGHKATALNGSTAWMEVPDSVEAFAPGTGDFTVEAWAGRDFGAGGTIASKLDEGGTNSGWDLQNFIGNVNAMVREGASVASITYFWANTGPPYDHLDVHHFVMRRIGGVLELWIDAQRVGSVAAPQNVNSTASLFVGRRSTIVNQAIAGDVSDVALYGTALSEVAILSHYQIGSGKLPVWYSAFAQRPDESEQRANAATWFTPDLPFEGLVPPPVVPFNLPAVVDWGADAQQDRSIQPVWFVPDAPTEGLIPPVAAAFDPASGFPWLDDHQQDRSIQPVWHQPADATEGLTTGTVTTATVAQQAGLWQDQSGQQDRYLQPVWNHPPDDAFAQFPTIPVPPPFTTDQLAGLWQEQPYPERGNQPVWYNAAVEPVDGPLQSWLFTIGSPGGGTPSVLFDIDNGDVLLYLGGNFVVKVS